MHKIRNDSRTLQEAEVQAEIIAAEAREKKISETRERISLDVPEWYMITK